MSSTETIEPVSVVTPSRSLPQRRSGSWLRSLAVLVILGGWAVWAIPSLVAMTELRQQVPKYLFPQFRGNIELGETRLNWMSPVVVKEIEIRDRDGTRLLKIGVFRTTQPLWKLITQPSSLGRIDLENLSIFVARSETGTNFDQTLFDFSSGSGSSTIPLLELLCSNGQVAIAKGADTEELFSLPLDAQVRVGDDDARTVAVNLGFRNSPEAERGIVLAMQIPTQGPKREMVGTFTATHASLQPFTPFINLWMPDCLLAGELHGTAEWSLSWGDKIAWDADSQLEILQLEASGWPGLHGDHLKLARAALTGKFSGTNDVARFHNLEFISDFCQTEVNGECPLSSLRALASNVEEVQALANDTLTVTGWLDAAKLAQELPRTLQLRENTQISRGKLTWDWRPDTKDGKRVWNGKLGFDELVAEVDGQPWRWESPLQGTVRMTRPGAELVCESIEMTGPYLRVRGSGTLSQGSLAARIDLDQLSGQLAAIVNWDQFRLAGKLSLEAAIARTEQEAVQLTGKALIDGLLVGPPQKPFWEERQLEAVVKLVGSGPATQPWETIDSARIDLTAGQDRLQAALLKSVKPGGAEPVAFKAALDGELGAWRSRLSPLLGKTFPRIEGSGEVGATVFWSPQEVRIEKGAIDAQPFRMNLSGWSIDEPALKGELTGNWTAATQTWSTRQTSLRGTFGQVACERGEMVFEAEKTPAFDGDLQFDVDLGRISKWQPTTTRQHWLGRAQGALRCQAQGAITAVAIDSEVAGLSYVTHNDSRSGGTAPGEYWTTQWSEPQFRLQGQGRLDGNTGQLDVKKVQASGTGFAVSGQARIRQQAEQIQFNTQGELSYDWSQLVSRLGKELSEKCELTGSGTRPFTLQGVWQRGQFQNGTAHEVTGQLGLGWDSFRWMGVRLGPAEVNASFTGDRGKVSPLQLEVAEGRLSLAPEFQFRPGVTLVTLPAGRVMDQVRLSPELCRENLKFMAPMLADAASIDGRFSLDLTEATWPVGAWGNGQAAGRLQILGARVEPGPVAYRLWQTIEQVRAVVQKRNPSSTREPLVMEIPEQTVQFQQANHRVSHDRLIVRMRDVEIQTSGSVGVDDTLDLVATIPVRDEWLSDDRIRQAFAGQTLRIPIRGTLKQPQADPGVLSELARKAAGGVIEKAIDGRLQEQLKRFLPK